MTYASDRLYDGYLRRNMAKIVSKVKVREIVVYLPCLTQTDREEIEAKRETTGNFNAMQLLLDCLRRRENWPEEFISALEKCEQSTLASEIQAEYDSLQGHRNAPLASPIVNAHPSLAPHLSPPNHAGPESLQTPKVSEPSPQASPGSEAGNGERNAAAGPSQSPVGASEPDGPAVSSQAPPSGHSSLPPSLAAASETSTRNPPASPPKPQVSPVKTPIQDSSPPGTSASQQPVESSDPTVHQVSANHQQAQPMQERSSAQQPGRITSAVAGSDQTDSRAASSSTAAGPEGEEEYLSEPETLHSFHDVQVHQPFETSTTLAPVTEEPYSGDSGRLQISSSTHNSVLHNEPEEDHYESILQSVSSVRVNVGHVSEDTPVLNHMGQAPSASNVCPAPASASLQNYNSHEAMQVSAGSVQQQPNPQRDQGAVLPYNLLENYYIPAAIAGVSALVMLWKLRN